MGIIKPANLALSFLLELCMLAAFGYWGFQIGSNGIVKVILGIGVPAAVAVFWGIFMAPMSTRRVARPTRVVLALVIFGLAALALAASGQSMLALIFAVIVVVNIVLASLWKQ